MIALDRLTDEQLLRQAFGVLMRELGADGYARFLRLTSAGGGDYTRDRDERLKGRTFDQILESIREHRKQRDS